MPALKYSQCTNSLSFSFEVCPHFFRFQILSDYYGFKFFSNKIHLSVFITCHFTILDFVLIIIAQVHPLALFSSQWIEKSFPPISYSVYRNLS
jgi:hypothetical protein